MSRHERLATDGRPAAVVHLAPDARAPVEDADPVLRRNPTAPAEAPAAPPPAVDAAAPVRKRAPRRAVLGVLLLAALGFGGWKGHDWWVDGRFLVETDDAYVQADVTLISSRVQGYVQQVLVTENDRVAAGQPLIQLDDGDYRIALATAQSRVATAGQTLSRIDAQIEGARAAVAQAEAARDAAQAQLTSAQANAQRFQGLTDRGVAPQADLDQATESLDTATAGLAQAEAAITSASAQVDVLTAQRAEAEGQRRELELAVDQAQRNLDLTVLRAPADGTVTNMTLETGDLVQPGARLAALVPSDAFYIEANYKETQIPDVVPGESVRVTFDAIPGQEFAGTVASAAPATGSVFSLLPAENATGNFTKVVQRVPVRIDLSPEAIESGALRAGLSAVVAVDTRTAPGDGPVVAQSE